MSHGGMAAVVSFSLFQAIVRIILVHSRDLF